ncbi:hypothetical protein J3458_007069 [Metarhizium acridum]|uniref:uncharacterized protein n=1 Tax=Metarhizium acridum TaxID=92637 RepID=UPI001C6C4955|nr:hypothetical protein J3458_007069 [Metarhizium acridum]
MANGDAELELWDHKGVGGDASLAMSGIMLLKMVSAQRHVKLISDTGISVVLSTVIGGAICESTTWRWILTAIMAIANVVLGTLLVAQFRSSQQKAHSHHHDHHEKKHTPIPIGGLPPVNSQIGYPPEEWRTEIFRLDEVYVEEPVGTENRHGCR